MRLCMLARVMLAPLLLAAVAAAPCAAQAALGGPEMRSAQAAPRGALRVDLRPISNGFGSGGWGIALGGELVLRGRLSLVAELQYMDLADGGARLLTAHLGPRAYLRPDALGGAFLGAYALGRLGFDLGDASIGGGLMLEAGWAWRPRFAPSLLVEPYIKYPWFVGEEILIGIAPGLALGWAF